MDRSLGRAWGRCVQCKQSNPRAKRGSEAICERIKEEVKKRGLKGKIRAMKSGCMDFCELGPNVMVFPDNIWHSGVTAEDVPALIEKYL